MELIGSILSGILMTASLAFMVFLGLMVLVFIAAILIAIWPITLVIIAIGTIVGVISYYKGGSLWEWI